MERGIHFRENWHIFWEILGEAELILKIWGAREKLFQGAEDFFHGDREINALFSGIKGAQTPLPWGPHKSLLWNSVHKTYESFTLLRQR